MNGFEGQGLACVRGARLVFKQVGFHVAPGAAMLVAGPNGAGKSSLLRLMAGLLQPIGGELLWNGAPVAQDPDGHRRRISYVGHLDALKPALSVAENLGFWARMDGQGPEVVTAALARLRIERLADVPARLLSSGQRRRTNLARATMGSPAIWLLDEPTVGLDTDGIAALEQAMAAHLDGGGIVIAASHVQMFEAGAHQLVMEALKPELRDDIW